jgi:hypothetical protein
MQTKLKRTRLLEEPVRTLLSQLSRDKAAILLNTIDVMWTGHILAIDGREERRRRKRKERERGGVIANSSHFRWQGRTFAFQSYLLGIQRDFHDYLGLDEGTSRPTPTFDCAERLQLSN